MGEDFDDAKKEAAPRFKVFLPAEMRTGSSVHRVHLLDLSVSGALVHAATPPEVGSIVDIICSQQPRKARVIWVRARRFGVRFTPVLTQQHVDAVIKQQRDAVERAARRIGRLD